MTVSRRNLMQAGAAAALAAPARRPQVFLISISGWVFARSSTLSAR